MDRKWGEIQLENAMHLQAGKWLIALNMHIYLKWLSPTYALIATNVGETYLFKTIFQRI